MPHSVSRAASACLPGRCVDLDDQVAAAEEHQPAPVRVRAVERHVEPEPRAVERGGALGIGGRDHDMIHRRDRRRRRSAPKAGAPWPVPGKTAARRAWLGRGARPLPRQASRRWPHRGFRRRVTGSGFSVSRSSRRCNFAMSLVRKQRLASPSPCSASTARMRSALALSPLGAISSSVTLSSVNSTRSAPSPPLRHDGARANSVW